MFNHSPAQSEHINILRSPSTGLFNKGATARKLSVLDYYAVHGIAANLWFLSECLEDKDVPVREKAAEVIIWIFRKLKSHQALSGGLKSVQLSTSGLDRFKKNFPANTYVQLLAIASFNQSGYVRQHAMVSLAQCGQPEAIHYLLLRSADWVKEVRKSAIAGIYHYLAPAWLPQWLQELPLVDWLLKVKRVDLRELHHAIIDFLLAAPLEPAALQLLAGNERARKLVFRYQLKRSGPTPFLRDAVFNDKNFLIRLELLQQLSALPEQEQRLILKKLLDDNSSRVRLTALYACKPHLDALWEKAETLLYDPSASVRDLARRYATNRGLDIASLYRRRLQWQLVSPGALMGLGEIGSKEDLPVFEMHIVSPEADTQSACLAAIYRLDEQSAVSYAIAMLGSPSRRVRTRCLAILSKDFDAGVLDKVREFYAHGGAAQRKTMLLLWGAMGGWKVIGDLVTAICDQDEAIQHLAWQYLRSWYRKSFTIFTTPAAGDLARAKQACSRVEMARLPMTVEQVSLWEQVSGYLMRY